MARLRILKTIDTYRRSIPQFGRFILVGLTTNGLGYGLYLVLTYFGISPTLSMTILYWSVTLMGYFGNRRLTFNDSGTMWSSGVRYLLVYGVGFVFQYAMLVTFYEQRGYPHQLVQIISACLVTGFLFFALKFFVFPKHTDLPPTAKS